MLDGFLPVYGVGVDPKLAVVADFQLNLKADHKNRQFLISKVDPKTF